MQEFFCFGARKRKNVKTKAYKKDCGRQKNLGKTHKIAL
jgi:hypothetical protein